MEIVLDFETENCGGVDLTVVGSSVYAQHPLTNIISLTWQFEDCEPVCWSPGSDVGWLLYHNAESSNTIWVAHSAGFEKDIWREIMVKVHGFPDIPNDRWRCAQASAAYHAVPMGLEKLCDALETTHRKDPGGHKLMKSVSRPNEQGEYNFDVTTLQSVYVYNKTDIFAQAEVHGVLGGLSPSELRVWQLDQRINERGIGVDARFCHAAIRVVERASVPLLREFEGLTGLRPGQRDKLLGWLRSRGADLPDLKKTTVDALIGSEEQPRWEVADLPRQAARALRLRQLVNHSSTTKLERMIGCTGSDGRARRLLQYHGAGPGRWAGRLFQPQNFPRGTVRIDGKPPNPDLLVAAIMSGDPEYVEAVIGAPAIECVASGLRHALVAGRGRVFNSGDFSGIECRIDLALAGQHDKCAMLAAGNDVYCDMAGKIYGRPITKADVEQRQIGKNTVLGCGFQMGWQTFTDRYLTHMLEPKEFAKTVIKAYRTEWAPLVPKLWKALEGAAMQAVVTRQKADAYGVEFQLVTKGKHTWLTATLPAGNILWYFNPRLAMKEMPWVDDEGNPVYKQAWVFSSWGGENGQHQRIAAYGGLITENVVQALARQLMVGAMYLCEDHGFPIVLTCHDEILTEPETGDLKALEQIMITLPDWAKAMKVPVQIEGWECERYRK